MLVPLYNKLSNLIDFIKLNIKIKMNCKINKLKMQNLKNN